MCRCVPQPDSGPALAARVAAWRARPGGVVLARVTRLDTLDVTRAAAFPGVDRPSSGLVVARLRVLRTWAPGAADTVTVGLTWVHGVVTSCDQLLEVGEEYLGVPGEPDAGGVRWVRRCGGTRPRAEAAAELAALGPGRAPSR